MDALCSPYGMGGCEEFPNGDQPQIATVYTDNAVSYSVVVCGLGISIDVHLDDRYLGFRMLDRKPDVDRATLVTVCQALEAVLAR